MTLVVRVLNPHLNHTFPMESISGLVSPLYYLCNPCAYGKSLTAAATPPIAATSPVVAISSIAATPPPTARFPVDATPQVGATPPATATPSYENTPNMPTNDGYWYNSNEGDGVPNDGNDGHTHPLLMKKI